MVSEVRSIALELEQLTDLDWWLLQPLLEDAVKVLASAVALDPVELPGFRAPRS